MGLLDSTKDIAEKGWQLYFPDDDTFVFRQLDVRDNWMIEKDSKGREIKAWMHELPKKFEGYKNIAAGSVIVCYGRDILWDYANKLTLVQDGKVQSDFRKGWMQKLCLAVIHRIDQEANPSSSMDKILTYLGIVALILGLSIALKVGVK